MRFLLTGLLTLCAFVLISPFSLAQTSVSVSGTISNAGGAPLQGATVRLRNTADTLKQHGVISKRNGEFVIQNVGRGTYTLRAELIGYAPYTKTINVGDADLTVDKILLAEASVDLSSVEIEGQAIASELKGDTAQFSARAYKTNVNATSEELVTKMPGVTVENGTVKAQGEEVQRVLVDGKRFFGDDARQTLQNVPADMVENVQVYNARTNISMFSGFDDGNTEKTINLVTKKDKRKGSFGNAQGGYGTDNRYNGSATYNSFDGDQRISLLGLTNNINQQNFSIQDLLGGMGMSGGRSQMMSSMANRPGGSAMFARMGGSATNLYIGQANGISTTHALGTQYSDQWGESTSVSGSYFFNYSNNNNNSATAREYVKPSGQTYQENNLANTISRNHRFTFRLESNLDTLNKLLVTPSISYQHRTAATDLLGTTALNADTLSNTNTVTNNTPTAFTAALNADYSHRFTPDGRTLAIELNTELRRASANGSLVSANTFAGIDTSTALDQVSKQKQNGNTIGADLSWVEPLGQLGLIRIQYEPTIVFNDADKQTMGYDSASSDYTTVLPLLTNTYTNTYTTHYMHATHRYQFDNTIITSGLGYQVASLNGRVTFPNAEDIQRTFYNVLPELQIRQRFSEKSEATIRYRLYTQPPSITQLQNVVDNSNPLQLSIGNPELGQTVGHNFMVRFRDIDWMAGKTLFGFVSADVNEKYIATRTIVTSSDTVVSGVALPPGATITAPVNLNGYVRLNSFVSYGIQVGLIKSNLNLNGGVNYVRTPSVVNGATNHSNNTGVRLGFYLGSNISEDLDISVGYDANFNFIVNTLTKDQDANYFSHTATGRLIWNLGIVACSTDVAHALYKGLGAGYDQVYTVWNAGVGLRLFDNAGELRLSVFDLLHQNASVYRTVNPVSIDNTQTQVITRYAMLTFSYRLRSFEKQGMPEGMPRAPRH